MGKIYPILVPFSIFPKSLTLLHVVLVHIILIQSQPAFALTPWCCLLGREAAYTNFIVFGLT